MGKYLKNSEKKKSSQQIKPYKKKCFGQHFLRKQSVVDNMISRVKILTTTSILEIGCGDGFLTKSIIDQTKCKKLTCYEIDEEWSDFVKNKIRDKRLDLINEDILSVSEESLQKDFPFIILANLPYQITFPLFFLFQKIRTSIQEGVVMVQEEVAQKIVSKNGKGYNKTSLFLQYYFEFELMEKVEPGAFTPPPKIFSRLVYFKPKVKIKPIPDEKLFWNFIKLCFLYPRRTLLNNLKTTDYDYSALPTEILNKRAQQINFDEFLNVWNVIKSSK